MRCEQHVGRPRTLALARVWEPESESVPPSASSQQPESKPLRAARRVPLDLPRLPLDVDLHPLHLEGVLREDPGHEKLTRVERFEPFE